MGRRLVLVAMLVTALVLTLPASASAIVYSGNTWRHGEALRYGSPKRIVSHADAVGGQSMGLLWRNSFAGDYVYLSGKANTLKVRVKATPCKGDPWLGVYLYRHDGTKWRAPVDTWYKLNVPKYAYRDLAVDAPSAGWYFLYFTMPYDAKTATCDRNVFIDHFIFVNY